MSRRSISYYLSAALMLVASAGLNMSEAEAGPVGCAQAIGSCVGGGVKVAKLIKASREACEALRDCKKVCRNDKSSVRRNARNDKKSCISSCNQKSGKAKRQCKKQCRAEKKSSFKIGNSDKRSCVQTCRDNYKTKACKKARKKMSLAIAGQGLKCAVQVTAQCAPIVP